MCRKWRVWCGWRPSVLPVGRYPPHVSSPPTYAAALRDAIADVTRGVGSARLTAATEALIGRYRTVAPAGPPILDSAERVAAYAAYRMPATHARARARCSRRSRRPVWRPRSTARPRRWHRRGGLGGGEAFASLTTITVLDQAEEALRLGQRLVEAAPTEALRLARFERAVAGAWPKRSADLVTVSYVLSELDRGAAATASSRTRWPRAGGRHRRARHSRRLPANPRGARRDP